MGYFGTTRISQPEHTGNLIKRFTDRIVAVNEINTLVTASIIILSRRLRAAYLLDVALVYALLGFTANVLLTRLLAADRKEEKKK